MNWAFFAFVAVFLFLAVAALLPTLGRLLKRRRLEIEAETEEVFGAPEGGVVWLSNGRTIH